MNVNFSIFPTKLSTTPINSLGGLVTTMYYKSKLYPLISYLYQTITLDIYLPNVEFGDLDVDSLLNQLLDQQPILEIVNDSVIKIDDIPIKYDRRERFENGAFATDEEYQEFSKPPLAITKKRLEFYVNNKLRERGENESRILMKRLKRRVAKKIKNYL